MAMRHCPALPAQACCRASTHCRGDRMLTREQAAAGVIALPYVPCRATYRTLKQIASDRAAMERSFESYQTALRSAVARFTAEGRQVVLVVVEPILLAAWATERGIECDAQARLRYAGELLNGSTVMGVPENV